MIPEKKYKVYVSAHGRATVTAKDEDEAIELALDIVELDYETTVESVVDTTKGVAWKEKKDFAEKR